MCCISYKSAFRQPPFSGDSPSINTHTHTRGRFVRHGRKIRSEDMHEYVYSSMRRIRAETVRSVPSPFTKKTKTRKKVHTRKMGCCLFVCLLKIRKEKERYVYIFAAARNDASVIGYYHRAFVCLVYSFFHTLTTTYIKSVGFFSAFVQYAFRVH